MIDLLPGLLLNRSCILKQTALDFIPEPSRRPESQPAWTPSGRLKSDRESSQVIDTNGRLWIEPNHRKGDQEPEISL